MDSENRKRLNDQPGVVWLGIISFIAALFVFTTGCKFLSTIAPQMTSTPAAQVAPTITPQTTDTPAAQIAPTITAALPEKTIIGLWERRSPEITEQVDFRDDGSYTIEARNNSTNDVVASNNGTYTYDQININYVDKDKIKFTESYYLDNGGDSLVINNRADLAWTRIK